jgi:hypothetical protein
MPSKERAGGLALVSEHSTDVVLGRQEELDRIRTRVIQLRDEMTDNYFEMGALLYRVSKEHLYRHWKGPDGKPYDKFSSYVEHEVDFAFRKAKYLMSIWWWFTEKLADPAVSERIREIGWGKAACLVGVVDGQNVDAWIERAKKLAVKKLAEECKVALEAAQRSRRPARGIQTPAKAQPSTTLTGEPSTRGAALPLPLPASGAPEKARMGVDPLSPEEAREFRRPWTILLSGEQVVHVENAIDRAGEMMEIENDGKGYLLEFIATSFLAVHSATVGNTMKDHQVNFRNEVLRAIERSMGVRLVAFDRQSMRPIFGQQTIDRILEEGGD